MSSATSNTTNAALPTPYRRLSTKRGGFFFPLQPPFPNHPNPSRLHHRPTPSEPTAAYFFYLYSFLILYILYIVSSAERKKRVSTSQRQQNRPHQPQHPSPRRPQLTPRTRPQPTPPHDSGPTLQARTQVPPPGKCQINIPAIATQSATPQGETASVDRSHNFRTATMRIHTNSILSTHITTHSSTSKKPERYNQLRFSIYLSMIWAISKRHNVKKKL